MGDLTERDMTAIASAIRILNEAGLDVEKANHATQSETGVSFTLDCHASTRSQFLMPQLEAVKSAAIAAPEFDMAGDPVEETGEDHD